MVASAEIFPGAVPSRGAVRPGGMLSTSRGANGGLVLHPGGNQVVSVWCGAESTLDVWSIDPVRAISSTPAEVELADTGSSLDHLLMPPGVDASRAGWPAHLLPIVDLAADARGQLYAAAAGRGIRLYQNDGSGDVRRVATLRGHESAVVRVALSSSGDRVVGTEASGRVVVWGTHEQRPLFDLRITRAPHSAAFLWNDLLVGVGDDVGRVICWEMQEGRRHLQFQAHRGAVHRMVFSSRAGLLLTTGADNVARVWNLETGRQVGADMPHAGPVHDAVFAHDGRFVVTAGGDGHLAVWSSATGKLVDWAFDGSPVYRLAYHPQSHFVLYGGPRTIRALDADWAALAAAEAGGSPLAAGPAIYSQPPVRPAVTYSGIAGSDAPVGAVMAARQTSDLPMPDRSNLAIQRDGGSPATGPVAFPLGGGGRTFGTQALPSIGGPSPAPQFVGRPQTMAVSGIASAPVPVAPPATDGVTRVAVPGVPAGFGARGGSPTASSQIVATPQRAAELADADDFFAGVFNAPSAGSALDANASLPPAIIAPPSGAVAAPSGAVVRPAPTAGSSADIRPAMPPSGAPSYDELLRADDAPATVGVGRAIPVVKPPPPASRAGVLAALLLGVVGGLGARYLVTQHYTVRAYPAAVAGEASVLESEYAEAVSTAEAQFARFEEERQTRLRELELSGRLASSELERVRADVARQIATADRERQQALESAESDRAGALHEIETVRSIEAAKLGLRAGLIAGAVMFVLGWVVQAMVGGRGGRSSRGAPAAKPATRPTRKGS